MVGLAVLVVPALLLAVATSPASAVWTPPVEAPIIDSFRPPASRFGAGNRGIEYDTVEGQSVRAVDRGRVAFVGAVGNARHVVIDHGDGLRSTYAFVSATSVVRGQFVEAGRQVAVAAPGFHLTARLGDVYVDPVLLFGGAEVRVRLTESAAAEPAARSQRLRPALAMFDALLDLTMVAQIKGFADSTIAWSHSECTEDGVVITSPIAGRPAHGRLLIEVGGLGSSSEGAAIGDLDVLALGYDPDNIVSFSYAGGCSPNPFGLTAGDGSLSAVVSSAPYGPEDTYQSIDVSAQLLADLIDEVSTERPGEPIDLAAHSLGGVVSARALAILSDRHPGGVPVEVAITIGSPHSGTDLATAAVATSGSGAVDWMIDPLLPDGGAQRHADSVLELAEAGGPSSGSSAPPPEVRAVAVAGATDLVVPAGHAVWDGAVNVVVPAGATDGVGLHSELPGRAEVQRELALAISGLPPRCVDLMAVLGSGVAARAISAAEDALTVVLGIAGSIL